MKRYRVFQRHRTLVFCLAVRLLAFHLPVLAQNMAADTTDTAGMAARLYGDSPCDTCAAMSGQLRTAIVPDNRNLTGTITENTEYRSPAIVSSQVIASGSVVYTAGEITLGPGFEVKAGAQFEAHATDEFWRVNMLTYNLYIHASTSYETHARYIKQFGADIVSLQEVKNPKKFKTLENSSGLKGEMCVILKDDSGIGMLWNPTVVGPPVRTHNSIMNTPNDGSNKQRAFMVAEFHEFCFVATHLSLATVHQKEMVDSILNHFIVKDCMANGKPVYVAGDMNEACDGNNIQRFNNHGFEILNDTSSAAHASHATFLKNSGTARYIDLILEHNTNPNHRLIDRGIPLSEAEREQWNKAVISDHFPYRVTVKLR